MTSTILILSMVFGAFGLGFVLYARNAGKILPGVVGAALMIVPYFISNVALLVVICVALTALPFIYRDH